MRAAKPFYLAAGGATQCGAAAAVQSRGEGEEGRERGEVDRERCGMAAAWSAELQR